MHVAEYVAVSRRARRVLPGFAIVAGCGWLMDASLLVGLSRILPPGVANLVSSLTAAVCVYLFAHCYVHDGRRSLVGVRLSVYGLYTVGLVLTASVALTRIAGAISAYAPAAVAVVVAKALITPPQFVGNFLVSRYLARASIGAV